MVKLHNVSPGLLVLPNGVEIAPGTWTELPAQYAKNEGVASWLADGLASHKAPPAEVQDELTATKAERDGLAAQVADLQAQLDAAKKPSK